jgi:pimeloyl-ACP methyl ester carboxylesterase
MNYSVAKLKALIANLPETLPHSSPIWLDLQNGGEFDQRRHMSEALLYLHPGPVDTLVVLCRPAREDTKLPGKFWGTLLQRGVHVLMLEDRRKLYFTAGLRALGESLAQSADSIQRLIDALGVSTVVTAGSSAGGPGALALTPALGASRCLLFSPVTSTESDFYAQRVGDAPAEDPVSRRWRRLFNGVPPEHQFCGHKLLSSMAKPAQVRLHYPSTLYWDKQWAELLQSTATLIPNESTETHALLRGEPANSPLALQEILGFLIPPAPAR